MKGSRWLSSSSDSFSLCSCPMGNATRYCSVNSGNCARPGSVVAAVVDVLQWWDLAQLGVPQLATHFFVFYYGVLADATPPVALAAFAAAGIARSEPMRTGTTAFRLSMGKALVPFAFVYTPALLMINFTWSAFLIALVSITVAIVGLGAAYTGYLRRPIRRPAFLVLNLLSLSLVFANPTTSAIAVPLVLLMVAWHMRALPGVDDSFAASPVPPDRP
jgi:TRAP-type uncharacterized transport system fused permease subunit